MTRWTAVLARLGMPTGDGRILTPGAITNRDLPLPLQWQRESDDAHKKAPVVGVIDDIQYGPDMVTATGSFIEGIEATGDAMRLVEAGVIGPSVDLDDIEYVYDENTEMAVVTKGRIAGATLVAIPAFAEVYIRMAAPDPTAPEPADPDQLDGNNIGTDMRTGDSPTPVSIPAPIAMPRERDIATPEQPTERMPAMGIVASVRSTGWSDMPIADETRDWDGPAAAGRVADWAGVDQDDATAEAWDRYARAFLIRKDDADPMTRGAYGYGIADIIDGTLTIVPRGVFAAAAALSGARGADPGEDGARAREVLSGIYRRMDRVAPWDEEGSLQASATALPPLDWFRNPNLEGPTPLTVDDTGRVYGHVATWGTCHVGLPGCVTPPSSPSEYAYFMVGAERTAEGVEVPVGKLTVGGGHAEPGMGFRAAADHYDNVGTAVASVFAGEDEHGIWVAGYMLPGTTDGQRAELMRSPLSGDWRRIGGNLELIAAHAVNVPGFPIKRAKVKFAAGAQMSLVGNFAVKQRSESTAPSVEPFNEARNHKARMRWIAAQMRLKGR